MLENFPFFENKERNVGSEIKKIEAIIQEQNGLIQKTAYIKPTDNERAYLKELNSLMDSLRAIEILEEKIFKLKAEDQEGDFSE